MVDIINFFINNRDNWIPLILISAIVTAVLTAQYFFIYCYIINRRLKNPEKKRRIKLIMPRFSCIIFAFIALLGTAKFCPGMMWELNFSYAQGAVGVDEIREYCYTYEQLKENENFTLYTAKSDDFEYSLFRNEKFNGIIDTRYGKNHEYIVFVKYIGDRKDIKGEDMFDCDCVNYSSDDSFVMRGGGSYYGRLDGDICVYGAASHHDMLALDVSVMKKDNYKKYEDDDFGEYNINDLIYMHESIKFNLDKNTFSAPKTDIF